MLNGKKLMMVGLSPVNGDDNDSDEAIVELDDDDYSDAVLLEGDDAVDEELIYYGEEHVGGDMWANVYVDDYINIHHPKIRFDYISALASRPLQIKPPSVFFSDV